MTNGIFFPLPPERYEQPANQKLLSASRHAPRAESDATTNRVEKEHTSSTNNKKGEKHARPCGVSIFSPFHPFTFSPF